MTRLEERYRRVLLMLPASYRAVWEEDMVATFLASVATGDPDRDEFLADYGRPSWSEVASVAALGFRARVGAVGASPRSQVWTEGVRLAVLAAMLFSAVAVTSVSVILLWQAEQLPFLPPPPADWMMSMRGDIWQIAWDMAGIAWLPAFLLLLFGQWRAAAAVTVLVLLPSAARAVQATVDLTRGAHPLVVTLWLDFLISVLLVMAMTVFHQDAPRVRPRPWLVALPVGVAVVPTLVFGAQSVSHTIPVLDWPGLCCLAIVIAGLGHLAGPRFGRVRLPAWSLALALLALLVLGLRVLSLADYLWVDGPPATRATLFGLGAIETFAVVAVGVPLARLAGHALRSLPPTTAGRPRSAAPPRPGPARNP